MQAWTMGRPTVMRQFSRAASFESKARAGLADAISQLPSNIAAAPASQGKPQRRSVTAIASKRI